jgi:hypothetical protein
VVTFATASVSDASKAARNGFQNSSKLFTVGFLPSFTPGGGHAGAAAASARSSSPSGVGLAPGATGAPGGKGTTVGAAPRLETTVLCSTGGLATLRSDEVGVELPDAGAAADGGLEIDPLDVGEPFDWQLTTQHVSTQANRARTAPKHIMNGIVDQRADTVNGKRSSRPYANLDGDESGGTRANGRPRGTVARQGRLPIPSRLRSREGNARAASNEPDEIEPAGQTQTRCGSAVACSSDVGKQPRADDDDNLHPESVAVGGSCGRKSVSCQTVIAMGRQRRSRGWRALVPSLGSLRVVECLATVVR